MANDRAINNPTCNVNILHQERTGEPLDCNSCTMECQFKKEVLKNETGK